MIDFINAVLLHPYVLAVYGVLLWQVEQWYTSKKSFKEFLKDAHKNIGRSLIWVGIVVVFDDEILSKYNKWAEVDYQQMPLFMYTMSGFFIDLIRTKIIDKVK